MLEFTALGPGFKLQGLDVVPVQNPTQCHDFNHLKGHDVLIDGRVRRVKGVEAFMHLAPWRAGEPIGLMLEMPAPCGAKLAPGQWWTRCGETDMGQTMPALCTHCGGKYKRAEVPVVPHPKFNNVLPEDMPPYCFKRTD